MEKEERDRMNQSKCEMARLKYCRKSLFGYCNAEDRDLETCPYLKAISETARLAIENSKHESIQEKLKEWVSGYKERISNSTDTLTLEDVVDVLEEFVND